MERNPFGSDGEREPGGDTERDVAGSSASAAGSDAGEPSDVDESPPVDDTGELSEGPVTQGADPSTPKWQPLPGGTWAPPPTPGPPAGAGWGAPAPREGWTSEAGQGWGPSEPWRGQGAPPPGQGWGPPAPPWETGEDVRARGYGGPGQGAGQPGQHGGSGGNGSPGGGYGPPGGWGQSGGYGPPGGYYGGSGGGPADGPPGGSSSGKRHWSTARKLVAVAAAAVVVAGAATAGSLLSTGSRQGSGGTKPVGTLPRPSKTQGASSTTINVKAIAKKIDPEVVDVTSVLGAENAEAEGTGMILNSHGEILTNNHVVEQATKITAQVDGKGRVYKVRVLGVDPKKDVALLEMQGASGLPHVQIGDSSKVSVGDPVVAIGNALGLGGTPTVTSGTISALNRAITASDAGAPSEHLKGLLQTDAPINRGDSGGPLVDARGRVIGMDTAAAQGTGSQGVSNVGFAIPINEALSIARQIQQGRASSTVFIGQQGIIGVDVETIQQAKQASSNPFVGGGTAQIPVSYGAFVAHVLSGSPAAAAGISSGDVIVGLNGSKVSTPQDLSNALGGDHPGEKVSVTWVGSSGARHTQTLSLAPGPPK